MKKIFIYVQETCERRQLDAARIKKYFTVNNCQVVNNPSNADIVFFITCGFLLNIIDDSLENIKRFQKYKAELIVAGCLPEIEKEGILKIFKGRMISTRNLDKIDELFPDFKIKYKDIPDENIRFENKKKDNILNFADNIFKNKKLLEKPYFKTRNNLLKLLVGEKSNIYRYYTRKDTLFNIRVCEGCMNNCSYCFIKKAVGPLKSKSINECINEFKKGLENGHNIIVITGDDTGSYGIDIGTSFPNILNKILKFPGGYKLVIRSLNPQWVVKYIDELEKIFKSGKIESADIPIQSNSKRILKLMNRFTDTEKVKDALLKLKKVSPTTKLNTCYILGFPTETKDEFIDTMNFINEINFSGHIFPFSIKDDIKIDLQGEIISKKELNNRIKYAKNYLIKNGYQITFFKNTKAYFFDKNL